jgi:hypothetical protein
MCAARDWYRVSIGVALLNLPGHLCHGVASCCNSIHHVSQKAIAQAGFANSSGNASGCFLLRAIILTRSHVNRALQRRVGLALKMAAGRRWFPFPGT